MSKLITVDLETTGSDWKTDQIHGVSVCYDEDVVEYHAFSKLPQKVKSELADPSIAKLGHNFRFDVLFLEANGVPVNGPLHDTMLLAKCINEHQPLGLKELSRAYRISELEAKRELDRTIAKRGLRHVGQLCKLDLENGEFFDLIAEYANEDTNNTFKLFLKLKQSIVAKDAEYKQRFGFKKTPLDVYIEEIMPLERILINMEKTGVLVDKQHQNELGTTLSNKAVILEANLNKACVAEINAMQLKMQEKARDKRVTEKAKQRIVAGEHKEATFSWRSPTQVSDLVYKGLRVPPRFWQKTDKGSLSVGSDARPRLMLDIGPKHRAYQVLQNYEEYYSCKDLYSKFVNGSSPAALNVVEHKGRIHGKFVQAPKTGRLSHQAPNMGNIPRGPDIKRLFVPDPGKVFWYFDYSQVEFRILAHMSQDANMIKACFGDPHSMTAELCGVDRPTAKTLNFAFLYGAMAKKAQMIFLKDAGQWKSLDEVNMLRDRFFEGYSSLEPYLNTVRNFIAKHGFSITPTGYMRRFPEVFTTSNKWEIMAAQRKGVNLLGQGFGASIMKRAMIGLHKAGYPMISQVHDSAMGMLDKSSDLAYHKKVIEDIAQNAFKLRVPLLAEVKFLNSFDEGDTYEYQGALSEQLRN